LSTIYTQGEMKGIRHTAAPRDCMCMCVCICKLCHVLFLSCGCVCMYVWVCLYRERMMMESTYLARAQKGKGGTSSW
jgi:hypothetical protein